MLKIGSKSAKLWLRMFTLNTRLNLRRERS
jgi:hypothetical protein